MECRSSAKEKKSKRVIVSRLSMMIVWVSLYRSWMWPEGAKRYWDYDQRSRERGSWSKSHLWNERLLHSLSRRNIIFLFFQLLILRNAVLLLFSSIMAFKLGLEFQFLFFWGCNSEWAYEQCTFNEHKMQSSVFSKLWFFIVFFLAKDCNYNWTMKERKKRRGKYSNKASELNFLPYVGNRSPIFCLQSDLHLSHIYQVVL